MASLRLILIEIVYTLVFFHIYELLLRERPGKDTHKRKIFWAIHSQLDLNQGQPDGKYNRYPYAEPSP